MSVLCHMDVSLFLSCESHLGGSSVLWGAFWLDSRLDQQPRFLFLILSASPGAANEFQVGHLGPCCLLSDLEEPSHWPSTLGCTDAACHLLLSSGACSPLF